LMVKFKWSPSERRMMFGIVKIALKDKCFINRVFKVAWFGSHAFILCSIFWYLDPDGGGTWGSLHTHFAIALKLRLIFKSDGA
jgi:hypothetical protein